MMQQISGKGRRKPQNWTALLCSSNAEANTRTRAIKEPLPGGVSATQQKGMLHPFRHVGVGVGVAWITAAADALLLFPSAVKEVSHGKNFLKGKQHDSRLLVRLTCP